jgi:hypothetical protein
MARGLRRLEGAVLNLGAALHMFDGVLNSSGNLAIFAAIRRASSFVSNLAADRCSWLLPGAVRHHESGADVLDSPRRRKSARRHLLNV